MPENQKPTPTKEPQIESVRSAGFVKVYANSAQIETSPWDFRLIFGEATPSGGKIAIEQSVTVIMSPQHAKAFLGILANNLREYEKQVGEIKLPAPPQELTEPEKVPKKN